MFAVSQCFITDEHDNDVPIEDNDASYYEELMYSQLADDCIAYQTYVWGD